jgi:PAS domain S-box-containing protein
LLVLTRCNEAILRAPDEERLFADVCRVVVEVGGYRMSWVGAAEDDARRTIRPVAWAGHEDGYLETIDVTWGDGPTGQGPTGTAAREGRVVLGSDFASEPALAPWRDRALRRGYACSSALPIVYDGIRVGVLTMYAADLRAFGDEELQLLQRLADDLGFGVVSLRRRVEKERAEQALLESNQSLRAIFDLSPDVTTLSRARDATILDVNASFEALTGWSREEAVGRSSFELGIWSNPHDRERVLGYLERDGAARNVEARLRTRSGEMRDVLISARILAHGGEPVLLTLARDVTELNRSARRYRLLAENVQDVIWTLDLKTLRFSYVSPAIRKLRGLSVEEALAEPFEESMTPESLARVASLMPGPAGAGQDGGTYTGIFDQPCADGTVKHVEITTSYVRNDLGRPVEILGVSRDATARVEAERALRANEARFRTIIERSSDLIVLLDRDGAVGFWSPGAVASLGREPEEVQGKPFLASVRPEDRLRVAEALSRILVHADETERVAFRMERKGGGLRSMDGLCRNLLDDPAVGALVLNLRDVTEQQHLEEHVRQAQRLESIGRLAGGVAHDFHNLLTVVLSCTESMQQAQAAGRPVDPEDLAGVHEAGQRGRDLTRQLLAFARKQVIEPVSLDLNRIVRGSEKLLRRVLGEDVRLEVRLAAEPWTTLADPSQVEQVLVNLAVNARDAMPGGGTLVVSTGNLRVEEGDAAAPAGARPGEWVQLTVRDTGSGMPPEVLAHVFEPFFTTKEQGKGTGLGLATVHGIVAQAGGHVHVESEPGRGTTFRIRLPRTDVPRAAHAPAPEPSTVRGGETVLVVEDDPRVRSVTVRALAGSGYAVLAAGSGEEAIEVARANRGGFDIVVADVVMPGMDGREVVDALRREVPGLRALYVSGYTQDVIARRGVLDSGVEFLPKPFTAGALVARVRAVLDAPARSAHA